MLEISRRGAVVVTLVSILFALGVFAREGSARSSQRLLLNVNSLTDTGTSKRFVVQVPTDSIFDSLGNLDRPAMVRRGIASGLLFSGITLTETQKDSIYAIFMRFDPISRQIDKEGGSQQIRQQRRDIVASQRRAAMRRQLTPTQQPIFDENVVEADRINREVFKQVLKIEAEESKK